jgi:hypothetical protein
MRAASAAMDVASLAAATTPLAIALLLAHHAELVATLVAPNARRLFAPRYGRSHRLAGVVYLVVLAIGLCDVAATVVATRAWGPRGAAGVFSTISPFPMGPNARVAHDVALGVAGVILTVTAARDFGRAHASARVKNVASGALDEDDTVTREEMLEHAFYQGLNLAQVLFLRATTSTAMRSCGQTPSALLLLLLVTSAWLLRPLFPVNRFSHNYTRAGRDPRALTSVLYRVKKYQYVFYKHFLLHGLNVTAAVSAAAATSNAATPPSFNPLRPDDVVFRTYWLGLNAAYVMEFFLQTLVKRKYASQSRMLRMNVALMVITTAPAVVVLAGVCLPAAVVSLALNFFSPGRELGNVALATCAAMLSRGGGSWWGDDDRGGAGGGWDARVVAGVFVCGVGPFRWIEAFARGRIAALRARAAKKE